jgi:hypothetical protein
MKKFITLASAGLLLLSLQGAQAQREVEPPAVPPMLEGQRPLAQPESREPAASKPAIEGKTKTKAKARTKAKAGSKASKKGRVKKARSKPTPRISKKKAHKTHNRKKAPAAGTQQRSGPGEG